MKKQISFLTAIFFAVSIAIVGCKPEVHTHTFAEEWTSDETDHWKAATCGCVDVEVEKVEHSFGEYVSNKDATTEADGTKTRKCEVCEYPETVTDEGSKLHTHTFAEEWSSDKTNLWHAATCGHEDEVSDKAEHSYGEWEVIQAATEEAEGSKKRVCSVCSYEDPEVIAKLEHTHKFASKWISDKTNHWHAATCEHKDEVSAKAEHSYGEWTITKEATEEAKGSKERVCNVCKYKETAEIAQLNHKHVTGENWETDEEYHYKTCTGCAEKLEIAAHEYEWTVIKEATEDAEGSKKGTCKVCKKEIVKTIEKLGHVHNFLSEWTSDASGHWNACVCGEKSDFAEHSYGEYVSNNDATTEKDGTKTRTCTVCNYAETVTDEGSKILFPEMVFVQGGTIEGATNENNYAGVFIEGRTVTLSDFYMGKYEVTQEEYANVMQGQKVTVGGTEYTLASNPSYCKESSSSFTLFTGDEQEKRPVEGVTWYDAVWYCNALSNKECLTPAYNIKVTTVNSDGNITAATVTLVEKANGYRLPTEAEWEYAARGGDPTAADWNYTFSGADSAYGSSYGYSENAGVDTVGWYSYNNITGTTGDTNLTHDVSGKGTHEVRKKVANRLGLYDMSGNVSEWCYDWYANMGTGTKTENDPTGATSGNLRVIRGGSWYDSANRASVCSRGNKIPYLRNYNLGFRVVRLAK